MAPCADEHPCRYSLLMDVGSVFDDCDEMIDGFEFCLPLGLAELVSDLALHTDLCLFNCHEDVQIRVIGSFAGHRLQRSSARDADNVAHQSWCCSGIKPHFRGQCAIEFRFSDEQLASVEEVHRVLSSRAVTGG